MSEAPKKEEGEPKEEGKRVFTHFSFPGPIRTRDIIKALRTPADGEGDGEPGPSSEGEGEEEPFDEEAEMEKYRPGRNLKKWSEIFPDGFSPTGYQGPEVYTKDMADSDPVMSLDDAKKLLGEYEPPGYWDPNSKHNVAMERYRCKNIKRNEGPWNTGVIGGLLSSNPPIKCYPTGNWKKWQSIEHRWRNWTFKHNKDKFPTIAMRDKVAAQLKPILIPNLKKAIKVFREQGGVKNLAKHTLMTKAMRERRCRYDIHIANAMGFSSPFDKATLTKAWDTYTSFNGWDASAVSLTVVSSTDKELPSCEAAFIHVKDEKEMAKAEVIKIWAYVTETKTYLAGRYQFGHFDGTSIFNFVKGLVHVYYGGEPYVNVQGGAALPSSSAPIVQIDQRIARTYFGLMAAVYVGFKESVVAAFVKAHSSVLPPPLKGLPPQHARCMSFDAKLTAQWVKAVKSQKAKPFEWMVRSLGAALRKAVPTERYAFWMVPISWMKHIYGVEEESKSCWPFLIKENIVDVPNRLVGDWLSIREQYIDLDQLGVNEEDKPEYMQDIHRQIEAEVDQYRGTARQQILRDFVYDSDEMFMPNKHRAFWFNNYGKREVHELAGNDVEYMWGPPKQLPMGLIVNTAVINGTLSITLQSSFADEGKLTMILEQLGKDMRECKYIAPPEIPKSGGTHWVYWGLVAPRGIPFKNPRLSYFLKRNIKCSEEDVKVLFDGETEVKLEDLHCAHVIESVDGAFFRPLSHKGLAEYRSKDHLRIYPPPLDVPLYEGDPTAAKYAAKWGTDVNENLKKFQAKVEACRAEVAATKAAEAAAKAAAEAAAVPVN